MPPFSNGPLEPSRASSGVFRDSAFVTVATAGYALANYNKVATPSLIAPIKDLRSWAFIFCRRHGRLTNGQRKCDAFTPETLPHR